MDAETSSLFVPVNFTVRAETQFGDSLLVTGNIPPLGERLKNCSDASDTAADTSKYRQGVLTHIDIAQSNTYLFAMIVASFRKYASVDISYFSSISSSEYDFCLMLIEPRFRVRCSYYLVFL